jgi:predicted transcriptional regulator
MPDEVGSVSLSLRVPADVLQKLDRIAAAVERPRSWVCLRAIRHYLADEGAEILDVRDGIAEADRGELVPVEEVMSGLEEIIREAEAKRSSG